MGINNFTGSGRLTADPVLKKTQSGKSVTNFTIAIQENKDKTEFVNCVAWEKSAEIIAQYCKKGQKLAVQGKLQTRSYEDGNGVKKYVTEVIVWGFDLPEKPKGEQSSYKAQDVNAPMQGGGTPEDIMEDGIPFMKMI